MATPIAISPLLHRLARTKPAPNSAAPVMMPANAHCHGAMGFGPFALAGLYF
jgi:hypothetical protein